jgi:deazaflavin-dependent oxidoreductase (nitroreductase family)
MDPIDTALIADNLPDFSKDHLRRYLGSNGKNGHLRVQIDGPPSQPTLILATRGRKTGKYYLTPLTYGTDSSRYVLVGSFGGAPDHPGWFKNLSADPNVRVQVGDKRFDAIAAVTSGPERERLWQLMVKALPLYSEYQTKTTRQLPVVLLTPKTTPSAAA